MLKSTRVALILACVGIAASGCSSGDMEANVTTVTPNTSVQPDTNQTLEPDLFGGLTDGLENAWAGDTKEGHVETCELWDTDNEVVLDALMPSDSAATYPLGLTSGQVRGEISRFFNGKCEN